MNLNQAQKLALDLMKHHGLIDSGWKFKFDRALRCLGGTRYNRLTGERRITLSTYNTATREEAAVRNTILHEIAHALVGAGMGHGLVWYTKAREIGCDGKRCGAVDNPAPAKYVAKCKLCSHEFKYYRKPRAVHLEQVYHKACGREGTLVWN